MNSLCIYHKDCPDGFGSAYIAKKCMKEIELYGGEYNKQPPDVVNKEVIIVDFSYPRDILLEMAEKANKILIIDHHKTAEKNLINLPDNVKTIFNMNQSGVTLTWQYFFPDRPIPELFLHIEDRDLWKFEIPHTKEIMAAVFSYPFEIEYWDDLVNKLSLEELKHQGTHLLRKHMLDIEKIAKNNSYIGEIAGMKVPVCNVPYFMASDVANVLCQNQLFAACYYITEEHVNFSLKSSKSGVDVARIAEMFGGGGHTHTAGFKVAHIQAVGSVIATY